MALDINGIHGNNASTLLLIVVYDCSFLCEFIWLCCRLCILFCLTIWNLSHTVSNDYFLEFNGLLSRVVLFRAGGPDEQKHGVQPDLPVCPGGPLVLPHWAPPRGIRYVQNLDCWLLNGPIYCVFVFLHHCKCRIARAQLNPLNWCVLRWGCSPDLQALLHPCSDQQLLHHPPGGAHQAGQVSLLSLSIGLGSCP